MPPNAAWAVGGVIVAGLSWTSVAEVLAPAGGPALPASD
jgi:hypothetical protein